MNITPTTNGSSTEIDFVNHSESDILDRIKKLIEEFVEKIRSKLSCEPNLSKKTVEEGKSSHKMPSLEAQFKDNQKEFQKILAPFFGVNPEVISCGHLKGYIKQLERFRESKNNHDYSTENVSQYIIDENKDLCSEIKRTSLAMIQEAEKAMIMDSNQFRPPKISMHGSPNECRKKYEENREEMYKDTGYQTFMFGVFKRSCTM